MIDGKDRARRDALNHRFRQPQRLWRSFAAVYSRFATDPAKACIAAVGLIAVAAAAMYLNQRTLIRAYDRVGAEIDVAGRQSMLSQRIGRLAIEASETTPGRRETVQADLAACADLMLRAHAALLSRDGDALRASAAEGMQCRAGDPPAAARAELPPDLRAAFLDGNPSLDELLRRFAERARAIAAAPAVNAEQADALARTGGGALLAELDGMTRAVRTEAERSRQRIDRREILSFAGFLAVLLAVALFILRPMARRAARARSDLEAGTENWRRSEALLNDVQRIAGIGGWTEDIGSGRETWSDNTYRIYGYEPGEVDTTNRLTHEHMHPDDDGIVTAAVRRCVEDGEAYHCEYRIIRKDGVVRHIVDKAEAVRDESGRATFMVGAIQDVTESKLLSDELQRALELANRANVVKNDYLSTVSHELRTPLNAIIGFAELMSSRTLGRLEVEDFEEYASDIHTSGQHLLSLINDILDLSSIEAGSRRLTMSVFDLHEAAEGCMVQVAQQAGAKDVRLLQNIERNKYSIHADRRAVFQILLNLVGNAVKFTNPEGEVRIDARAASGRIIIEVSDTGADIADAVSEPFVRGQTDAYATGPGTGLGLAIVKSLVEAHGGETAVSSVTGEGTKVTVALPAAS